jgi:hypothetical protein
VTRTGASASGLELPMPMTVDHDQARARAERTLLRKLLAINAALFVVELAAGWAADSMGLVADSLDMLADAGVYGVALGVTGRGPLAKARAAATSGVLQLGLAGLAVVEVARRAWRACRAPVPGHDRGPSSPWSATPPACGSCESTAGARCTCARATSSPPPTCRPTWA